MEENLNWLLWWLEDQVSNNDYLASAVNDIPQLQRQDWIFYQYNQGWSSDCTLYASITALSSTMNYIFSEKEIQEIKDLAVTQGKIRNDWWYLRKAIDCVRNYWNVKYPERKVVSVQLQMLSDASTYRNKWYFVATTFKWNKAYWVDKNDNGIVNWLDFKPSTFWHAINTRFNNIVNVIDNYFWNKNNIYWLANYSHLVKNGVYSWQWYVFLSTTDEKKEELKRKSRMLVLLKEIITLTNDKKFIEDCKNKIRFINSTIS